MSVGIWQIFKVMSNIGTLREVLFAIHTHSFIQPNPHTFIQTLILPSFLSTGDPPFSFIQIIKSKSTTFTKSSQAT